MTTNSLVNQSLFKLASCLKKKVISPVEIVDAYLGRIKSSNSTLHAYITVVEKLSRQNAKSAETQIQQGKYKGPLHGIPYACKDLFATKGIRTTAGSKVLADWIPEVNAVAISQLSTAGSVLLGKLNQHEFAYGATGENKHFGTVPNPWDNSRLAGGSSSGSAAAVAAGLAPYALGTDTGGSTRAPAALCGVVGYKPTFGLISTNGIIPYCWSLDHVGILAKTVEDTACVFNVLTDHRYHDLYSTQQPFYPFTKKPADDLRSIRIGVPRSFFFEQMDEEIYSALQHSLQNCERLKAELIDIDLPPMDQARTVSLLVQLPEMLSYHGRYLPKKKQLYGDDIRAGMAVGQFILAEHYIRAKRMMQWYRLQMERPFETVDIIVTPSCPIVAPKISSNFVDWGDKTEPVGNAITRYTSFFNMTGHPAISIPCEFHSLGLPIGIQLVGRHFSDQHLISVSRVIEKNLGRLH